MFSDNSSLLRSSRGFFMDEGVSPQFVQQQQSRIFGRPQASNVFDNRPSLLREPPQPVPPPGGRPNNPLETHLTDKQLFSTFPNDLQRILDMAQMSGQISDDGTELLRVYLEQLMLEGGNPFLAVKLYQKCLGGNIKRVLAKDTMAALDFYWEKWSPPPQLGSQPAPPAPTETKESAVPSEEVLTFSTNPLLVRPESIPGVVKSGSGYQGSEDTVQWIKLILFLYARKGEVEEVVKKFAQQMKGYFGEELVRRAINEAESDNLTLPAGIQRVEPQLDEETASLKKLIEAVTHTDLPGITLKGGRSSFGYETITWIQLKLSRMLIRGLNPDPFVRKLYDMFGEEDLCRAMTEDYVQWLRKEMPASKQPGGNFLEWLISEVVSSPPRIPNSAETQGKEAVVAERPRVLAQGQEGGIPGGKNFPGFRQQQQPRSLLGGEPTRPPMVEAPPRNIADVYSAGLLGPGPQEPERGLSAVGGGFRMDPAYGRPFMGGMLMGRGDGPMERGPMMRPAPPPFGASGIGMKREMGGMFGEGRYQGSLFGRGTYEPRRKRGAAGSYKE